MDYRRIGQSIGQFPPSHPLTLRTLTPSFQGSNPCSPANDTSAVRTAEVIFFARGGATASGHRQKISNIPTITQKNVVA